MNRSYPLIIIFLLSVTSCTKKPDNKNASFQPISKSQFIMDTIVTISIFDKNIDSLTATQALDKAFKTIKTIEKISSAHLADSELSKLQNGRNNKLSPGLQYLLNKSLAISRHTGGCFNPAIGNLKKLWDFNTTTAKPPASEKIKKEVAALKFGNLAFNPDSSLSLKKNTSLDLGGIAKGWAIDRTVQTLKNMGIKSGIVDAGGDLRIFGKHPDKPNWRIGIRHPRQQGKLFGIVNLSQGSIATSGDYERFFMYEGQRYHHLLDPVTGYPARECISVTIRSPAAISADAYATAIFIMGPAKGMNFIESTAGLEGLIIYQESGKLGYKISTGLKEFIKIL